MRLSAVSVIGFCLAAALSCKTARTARDARQDPDALASMQELPACDDITLGRVYWVRDLRRQMECVEGGNWKPREIDTGDSEADFGPRTIH